MTDPDPTKAPPNFRQKPSRNQRTRSKLRQIPDASAPLAPPPATPTPLPPAPIAPLRKMRLKRSGQMHEDLTKPRPERPAEPETEY